MSAYSSAILADSPQVYLRLDEVSSSVAYDSSGNGYNATLTGTYTQNQPGAITGDPDTSIYLGLNGTINLPYGLNYTTWTALSIEYWTNVTGSWVHVVLTCNNTTTLTYINGVVSSPVTPSLIEVSAIFDFAGATQACNIDEFCLYNYVLSPSQIAHHYSVATTAPTTQTSSVSGGVQLLISDIYYPTIRQETINIDRTANDPIPTFKITIQDDPSQLSISELQEVIFIDSSQIANPTHNLLQNPLISPYTTNWTATTATGGSFNNLTPGVQLVASNAANTFGLAQSTQNGLVIAGHSYMYSCYVQTSTLTGLSAYMSLSFLTANGTNLGTQTLTIGTSTANTRYSLSGTAPNGCATIQIAFGLLQNNSTNSGSASFTSVQLEPMTFTSGLNQITYPSPFCANGQANCTLMPDGTTIRQYRLFGGYVTKATAGKYVGPNRQWQLTVSGYAWLLQKQLLNNSWSNTADNTIINNIVTTYFPNQFSTAQVVKGATLNVFGYTYNGTARDAFDALAANANFYYYVDPYRVIWYQPPGYNLLSFMLSDKPDNVTSYPYYDYSLDIDGTQLGNATLVVGASGISAVEYDAQSIGYYNQITNGSGIFWRTVNDSTITTTAAAQQRAIAENTQYNYARKIAKLTTNQLMIPGYTVLFSSVTDGIYEAKFLVQRATLVLMGFQSLDTPIYECQCEIGAWNPDLINITVKMLRKQLVNANNIGTPVQGLMATESMTFVDNIVVTTVVSSPATYNMGVYGVSTYGSSVPGIPSTQYGAASATYGNTSVGYN
jgi:hypothetical protein